MPRSHAFTALCPNRHELTLWTARAGRCDGCHRFVAEGEQVMDCRACNWYLCGDCRPNTSEQVESMWGAVSNLFFGDVCRAPPGQELEVAEVVVGPLAGTSARASRDYDVPVTRPLPPPRLPQQQQQWQQLLPQAAGIIDSAGDRSHCNGASVVVPPPPPSLEKAPLQKKTEEGLAATAAAPPPLAQEMTDLLDLAVEPKVPEAASAAGTVGDRSRCDKASSAVPLPPPSPPVVLEEALVQKDTEEESAAAAVAPPPLAREMTDLIDLTVEPRVADPFDLATVDFAAAEAPKKAPLDDSSLQLAAASLVGGA